MPAQLTARFARYPEPLRRMLALGSCGRNHLLETAALGLDSHQPDTAQACARMLLSAWGESPLSGDLAGMLLAAPALGPHLSQEARRLLERVRSRWNRPDNLDYYERLSAQRRFDKLRRFLETQLDKEPGNLFWQEQAMVLALFEGDHQWTRALLDREPLADLGPCLAAARCQAALLAGDAETALNHAQAMGDLFGPGFPAVLMARAHQLQGDAGQAAAQLREALDQDPWRTSQALALSEGLLEPGAAPLPGSLAILLYSWNKADDLAATLEALLASDLDAAQNGARGGSHIFVLDNGSTDHTPEVLARFLDRAGKRLTAIRLPVNVGAPAARNWLMNLPEVNARDFCLYLDDDALVPPDQLSRLGAAVARYPDAGVWGCKVVDAAQPALIQAADYHFHPLAELSEPDLSRIQPNPIRLSNLHVQTLDLGQFDYCRPCASVTGCCHLFRTETLRGLGGFSLNLSPSQYDDMEHDLRLNAQGGYAVYQGGLAVAHAKRTGRAGLTDARESAGALGNRYKLQVMHPAEEIAKSRERDLERTLADLETRYQLLDRERLDCDRLDQGSG